MEATTHPDDAADAIAAALAAHKALLRDLNAHHRLIGVLRLSPLGSPSQRRNTKYTGEVLRKVRAAYGVGRPVAQLPWFTAE